MLKISDFLITVNCIDWFSNSGIPNENYHVLHSIFEAYDGWNHKMLEVWEPQISLLERQAQEVIGDAQIDTTFSVISSAIDEKIGNKWWLFVERQQLQEEAGLEQEMMDMIKRDLSWACVEACLREQGFFTTLLHIYQEGYFPCAWEGIYPQGKAVVL